MRRLPLLLLAAAVAAGCGDNALYPLETGGTWQYAVRSGFTSDVINLRVDGRQSVAATAGWRLSSELGAVQLAWRGKVLLLEEAAGTRFTPALPWLRSDSSDPRRTWVGSATTFGRTLEASAVIAQAKDRIVLGSRKLDVQKVSVQMRAGPRSIETITWFAPGIGPVRQEQRVDGRLTRSLEYLSGP